MVLERHYTEFLKAKLEERVSANPRYSMRAFARDLGLSPSRLSELLHQKQGLSERSARQICSRLNLTPGETERFCDLVLASDSRSKKARRQAIAKVMQQKVQAPEAQLIREDSFRIISDWYHYAILELITVRGFKSDPRWIASTLGITVAATQLAIDRLARLKLIEVKNGRIRSTGVQLETTNDVPSEALRKFHRQLLEKAIEAISLQRVEERELQSLTIAVDDRDLPKLKAAIRNLKSQFNQAVESQNLIKKPNQVYALTIQFFRLNSRRNEK